MRRKISIVGAVVCLFVAATGFAMVTYWRIASGSWLNEHLMAWQTIVLPSCLGVFLFTRIVGKKT